MQSTLRPTCFPLLLVLFSSSSSACAQNIITTLAGTDFIFPRSVRAVDAPLDRVVCAATDARGNVYVCDEQNHIVARVSRDGMLTVVAGNGIPRGGFSGDGGPATSASLNLPQRVVLDSAGNLYIADTENHRIRKVGLDGRISTVAGTGQAGFSGDRGPGMNAELNGPYGLAWDPSGVLYIADSRNQRIRKLAPDNTITTVAGTGQAGFSGDGGSAVNAAFYNPYDVVVDSAGNLYVADTDNRRVRKVSPQGTITTLAEIGHPRGLAVDTSGNVYVAAGWGVNLVAKVDPSGRVTVIAGGGSSLGDGGPATSAALDAPPGVAVDAAGNVYVADWGNSRLRKVNTLGIITTLAGSGQPALSGDGGQAAGATLSKPAAMVMDGAGNLYVADSGNNRVRKISPQGIIATVAGGGIALGDGGPATAALLSNPQGLALDGRGNLYIADENNCRIRKVDPQGTITTVAGRSCLSSGGDGRPAVDASLYYPTGVAVDAAGNLYIAESGYLGRCIRKVNAQGIISTVVSDLDFPHAVIVDGAGNLYFSESGDVFRMNRVRKVTPAGVITTVAGVGDRGFSGDGGPAASAALNGPTAILLDAAGNLYIADTGNNRIRKVNASGVISTVAGNGTDNFTADGDPATATGLNRPEGMAVDAAGNLYIADTGNARIRLVWARPGAYSVSPQRLAFTAQAGSALSTSQQLALLPNITGLAWATTDVLTGSGGSWLSVSAFTGRMPSLLSVSANPRNLTPGAYQGTIAIAAPAASPSAVTIPVTFTVTSGQPPGLLVQPPSLEFRVPAGEAAPPPQSLRIENTTGSDLGWTAGTATVVGSWLGISPASGQTPASLQVSANPAGLAAGSHSGTVTVRSATGNLSVTVPVNLVISSSTAGILLLSQTSLLFKAVEGGGAEPPQTFGVLNSSRGALDWAAQATESWLSLAPASGRSEYAGTQIPPVSVSVDPGGLSPGFYVGLVRVSSNGANNSPQVVRVEMQVLPRGTKLGAVVRPTGVIFVAVAGGASPGAQELNVATPETAPIQFLSQPIGGAWVSRFPEAGNASRDNPGRIMVQPALGSLAAGTYRGGLTVMSVNDGALHPVSLLLLVLPPGTPVQPSWAAWPGLAPGGVAFSSFPADGPVGAASTCAPAQLHVQFTSLFASFQAVVGWPTTMRVLVRDDCGNPMAGGTVVLSFSNGDPALVLTDLRDGHYQGSWSPNLYQAQAVVTARALWQKLEGQAAAVAQVGLNPNSKDVTLSQGGVVLGAGFERGPVAPGSIISLFGRNFAVEAGVATSLPLPRKISGVRILVGEKEAPLFYVGPAQVNAQVLVELEVERQLQVRVEANGVSSAPEPLQTAATRPGIFTLGPPWGSQGAILIANTDRLAMSPDPNMPRPVEPARAGGIIQIYCTGLGSTEPPVDSGQPGPAAEPLARVKTPVAVTIGGKPAAVTFAGLAPGFVGVYQVNAEVPAGLTPGDAAPVLITQGGFASNTATIAVR